MEIRAWNHYENKIIDWKELRVEKTENELDLFVVLFEGVEGSYYDEFDLMPFSTLKDMDGKKIFKGDIVRIFDDVDSNDGWNEEVIFHRGCFMAGDDNLLCNVNFRCKVIGNKYADFKLLNP